MSNETKCGFRAYGENAGTFLIFQSLAAKPNAIADVFIKRLKQFGSGQEKKWDDLTSPEVWLFPNFGKGAGFGEPDVLVLSEKYAFWVEVETTINCKTKIPALRKSLLQLWRFRLFAHALNRPSTTKLNSRRIVGRTLTDAGNERSAELRLRGHGVLQQIRNKLAKADHHFVLFTIDQPSGEGKGGDGYAKALEKQVNRIAEDYDQSLPRLDIKKCWYAYWKGDLETPFNKFPGNELMIDDHYVRIKRGR